MESILSGIRNVFVYIDDILVTGLNEDTHLEALEEVLKRLAAAGLRLKRDKCIFMAQLVVYLGHKIDAEGLHPLLEKVQAVQEAPKQRNVSELKSYIGLLSYYSKKLPNLSTVLWTQMLKMQLSSASVVSKINQLHRQLHFNLGVGRQGPGLAYM